MATCPHCLGALTDDHRCPRKRRMRLIHMAGSATAGGATGFIAMALLDPAQHSTHLDIWVILTAAFLGVGFYHLLSRS